MELWEGVENLIDDYEFVQECLPPPLPKDPDNSTINNPIVSWMVGFLLLLQAKHGVPDTAINAFLRFLRVMLRILGRHSIVVGSLAISIPSSDYNLNKHVRSSGVRYLVVCCKFHQLYSFNDC